MQPTEQKNINRRRFFRPVDKRSRQEMVSYLSGHFRYDTMNSWNRSTSYACNLKIHSLRLDAGTVDKLYALSQVPEFYDRFSGLIHDFDLENNYEWQAGWNGRSGGYLVLYQGKREPSGYRSYCTCCGQKNYTSVADTGTRCGVCHEEARVDYITPPDRIVTYPGRGLDMEDDYAEWSMAELRERVELVQAFDRLADDIVAAALEMAETCAVQEQVVYIPSTRLVLVQGEDG